MNKEAETVEITIELTEKQTEMIDKLVGLLGRNRRKVANFIISTWLFHENIIDKLED